MDKAVTQRKCSRVERKVKHSPLLALPSLSCSEERRARAVMAVVSTTLIIKLSEVLAESGSALAWPLLCSAALAEWLLLDASWASLVLALVVSVFGPLAELPFIAIGAWHYLPSASDVTFFGLGLSKLTGPCYFAVCTRATVRRIFVSGRFRPSEVARWLRLYAKR